MANENIYREIAQIFYEKFTKELSEGVDVDTKLIKELFDDTADVKDYPGLDNKIVKWYADNYAKCDEMYVVITDNPIVLLLAKKLMLNCNYLYMDKFIAKIRNSEFFNLFKDEPILTFFFFQSKKAYEDFNYYLNEARKIALENKLLERMVNLELNCVDITKMGNFDELDEYDKIVYTRFVNKNEAIKKLTYEDLEKPIDLSYTVLSSHSVIQSSDYKDDSDNLKKIKSCLLDKDKLLLRLIDLVLLAYIVDLITDEDGDIKGEIPDIRYVELMPCLLEAIYEKKKRKGITDNLLSYSKYELESLIGIKLEIFQVDKLVLLLGMRNTAKVIAKQIVDNEENFFFDFLIAYAFMNIAAIQLPVILGLADMIINLCVDGQLKEKETDDSMIYN